MAVLYCRDNGTVGWSGVTAWATGATIAAGALRRQSATPTVGNERVFIAIVGGTTHATTEPTWSITKGAKTTDNTVTWQECTGQPAVNGNLTDTPLSSSVRSTNPGLGKIIKDNAGTHIFICSTAGTCGAGEPTYTTAAVGNTTTDSGCTWTYIGASFSSWAAPHARLSHAHTSTWGAVGDTFIFADDHAETQAAPISINLFGVVSNPTFHYSIDHTGSVVPASATLLAGASVTTTGNNAITLTGSTTGAYFNGITFNCGSGAVAALLTVTNAGGMWMRFENCDLKKNGTTGTASAITFGANAAGADLIELINTRVSFGSATDSIRILAARVIWRNTASAIGGTTPTTLFSAQNKSGGNILIEGVDLSVLGSGKKILAASTASDAAAFLLVDCKLGASVTVADTPTSPIGSTLDLVRCDSGATTYRQERYWYQGTLTNETTIVRTGGATDGTTPLAWKIITTANSKWVLPFESFTVPIWNNTVGSPVTLTMYGTWGGGAVPDNGDIQIDAQYFGSSGSPIASVVSSGKANNLATASALSSDGSTWGGGTTPFKMQVTFTPQLAGHVRVRVRAARPSSTFYIDPTPVLS